MTDQTDRPDADGRFAPQVVAAVCQHLNDDHGQDLRLMAQTLGGFAAASAATATGLDAHGLDLEVVADDSTPHQVRVTFPAPATRRADLREVLTDLTMRARDLLGTPPPSPGFAALLREATSPDHARSEDAPFLDDLLAGRLGIGAFHALARQHREIYTALETATEQLRDEPTVAGFLAPELARQDALEADLQWLLSADPGSPPPILPATDRYVERIREVAATWPAGFVAHHYTRYLGDLSGGLHIGRVLHRRFAGGTNFYRFTAIEDVRGFKQRYRTLLDQAPWDAAERERLIAEVVLAYDLNRQVFADLHRFVTADEDASIEVVGTEVGA